MTVILKYPVKGWPVPPLPEDVRDWLVEHPECKELEDQFHHGHGYRVLVFYDDCSATAFKLRFMQNEKNIN